MEIYVVNVKTFFNIINIFYSSFFSIFLSDIVLLSKVSFRMSKEGRNGIIGEMPAIWR